VNHRAISSNFKTINPHKNLWFNHRWENKAIHCLAKSGGSDDAIALVRQLYCKQMGVIPSKASQIGINPTLDAPTAINLNTHVSMPCWILSKRVGSGPIVSTPRLRKSSTRKSFFEVLIQRAAKVAPGANMAGRLLVGPLSCEGRKIVAS
jgi:hypothetical protein